MIEVIFEAQPQAGRADPYFDMAAKLRPKLEQIDGFLSIERYESLTTPGKFLSLSFWRDAAAVAEWRRLSEHRNAQTAGRNTVFQDYRLRVAAVMRDYGLQDRAAAPEDSRAVHG